MNSNWFLLRGIAGSDPYIHLHYMLVHIYKFSIYIFVCIFVGTDELR